MDDLASRDAPLEYWFWKARTLTGGAIIDYIVRRDRGEAELRVSLWDDGVIPVIHHRTTRWTTSTHGVRIDDAVLDERGSTGHAAGVDWEVSWDLGDLRLAPRPDWFGPVHPFDMELVARPGALLAGRLVVDGREQVLHGGGSVAHYWGRRLPDAWAWISATGFDDDPGARFEALLVRSRLWGTRASIPAGYAWLDRGGRTDVTVMPLTGLVSASTGPHEVRMSSRRLGGRGLTVRCTAARSTFNDAGEGIRQSTSGDLTVDGVGRATGHVGLEFRS